ncbi:MAG: M3 family oligoendopeptidase [Bacilli bacterium]
MNNWSLKNLYLGLDDPKFIKDQELLDQSLEMLVKEAKKVAEDSNFSNENVIKNLENSLIFQEEINMLATKLFAFVSLTLAVDSRNMEFNNAMVVLQQKAVKFALPETLFRKYVARIENLENLIKQSELLTEYKFMLNEIKEDSIHLLSEVEEVMAAELNQSGGSLFSKQQNDLTSSVEINFRGEVKNLAQIRNLAYVDDQETRKEAYFAELDAYKKIDKATAFSLNGIKKQVITMANKRKYDSPLDEALRLSRINKDVLDALIQAMKEYLPEFRKYLNRKGELLGHKNGLPFYDLFAPMGSSNKKYSIEEAKEFVLKNFKTFSDDLYGLAKRAFDEDWVDWTPKQGKRGGAFCSRIYPLKESRIMTNYDGSIGDISTVAHELGHAYHNFIVYNERIFNADYPMPIAETASILCETIVKKAVLKESKDKNEILGMIEQELQDSTQVIVDILSRFIFESEVFARTKNEFLNEDTLNQIMIKAQLESYGDGLDKDFLNPGMWINKSHYYSTGRSFYNFPYAFGLLFAKGIYAKYLEIGEDFVEDLRQLLRTTGKASLIDVAKQINIDITDVQFWRSSLEVIKKDIELFLDITK